MADIKLFRVKKDKVDELKGSSMQVEKSLQDMIEKNLEEFLGIRFLTSEYSTGKSHRGRIDSLGIDENNCPVIIEYKRSMNENVINQGLFYLDWLMDHKAEFKLLVMEKFGISGKGMSSRWSRKVDIEWSSPRLLCIAGDFTKYDEHAVQQMDRNIELIRYRKYGDELILFELINAATATSAEPKSKRKKKSENGERKYKTCSEILREIKGPLRDRYESLKAFVESLGDDVQTKVLKQQVAFKRMRNFVCLEIHTRLEKIVIYVKVDPTTVKLEKGFTRDVRKIRHWGTGDLEITISNDEDFEKAKSLILKSYEGS